MTVIREFFHSIKFKIIVAVLAVLLGFMIYSVTTGGYADPASDLWSRIISPFQKLSTSISDRVSSSLDMLANAEDYYNENQKLKSEINSLYNEMIDYDRLKQENEDLRAMLELSEEYEDFTFSPPCSVIARTTNDPYASFTIDKGSSSGIEPGDPVVTSEGIVGVCYDVAENTSGVRTLFSPKTAIGVYSLRTRTTGIIEGGYELAADGYCRMSYIDKTADIAEGDIIITSGSASYPAGQLVGVVVETSMEDSGLSMYAVVKPAVNPAAVSDVFVITGFDYEEPPAEEPETIAADSDEITEETQPEETSETAENDISEDTEMTDITEEEISP
ncbi:MAG: rod shape-determining protein MreC [Oscillospiraceae bacterium]